MKVDIKKKERVKRIFDTISPKYDFLNHFLSAGTDYYWRRKAIELSSFNSESILLDMACGTGDFAITARKKGVKTIFGGDLSLNMLSHFKDKSEWINGRLVQCTAEELPFKDNTFTNITVAFGVRNFYDIQKGFDSFRRVLKEGGKVTILEFRLPANKFIRAIYLFYFNKILPALGRIISRDPEAYRYLPESVGEFDRRIDLVKLLKNSGFKNVEKYSLTMGLVQVVIARK
ncbi:bifunctional demethylmenaquinone methyltransferase/2-methoxy-6-polyprenyl-1,4-benzoquinol methylase UbiE [Melioribacter sp. Ez-97]|uniref:bifunctional demethylmenaquinone methyltransferase/2-methoxy-6-polyprenyl-1,4-benzoquinol methylase UbiE n=1 Tax=Melioribacter sp. Ez-97 TaxID=3423434 RepID=UPI003ED92411